MSTCNKGLLIDLDGTLVDNLESMYGAYSTFLSNYQQRPSKNEFELYNGAPLGKIIENITVEKLTDELRKELAQLMGGVTEPDEEDAPVTLN
jgi:phosphoglycolate phosphatase-like HAD superfamily hydrolase